MYRPGVMYEGVPFEVLIEYFEEALGAQLEAERLYSVGKLPWELVLAQMIQTELVETIVMRRFELRGTSNNTGM